MKTIDDALELRGRIFGAFEMAENEEDPEARGRWLTFVVVGGGRHRGRGRRSDRRAVPLGAQGQLPPDRPARGHRWCWSTAARRSSATFGDRLSHKAAARAAAPRRDASGPAPSSPGSTRSVSTSSRGRVARTGSAPARRSGPPACRRHRSPACSRRPAEPTCDRAGRIEVLDDCTLPGHPEVFAIGDMMALHELPGVAEVAMQSGIHAANTDQASPPRQGRGRRSPTATSAAWPRSRASTPS